MRHTDNKITSAVFDSCVNSYFKSWNETFTSFESKTFHSVELLTKESSELVSPVQSVVEMEFFFFIHTVVLDTFKVDTDPILNFSIRDVRELNANLATIGCLVRCNNVFQFPSFFLRKNTTSVGEFDVKFPF